jgi:hypothetical protein
MNRFPRLMPAPSSSELRKVDHSPCPAVQQPRLQDALKAKFVLTDEEDEKTACDEFGGDDAPRHGRSQPGPWDRSTQAAPLEACHARLLPLWKPICDRLIVKSPNVTRQVSRTPFRKLSKQGWLNASMAFEYFLITGAKRALAGGDLLHRHRVSAYVQ